MSVTETRSFLVHDFDEGMVKAVDVFVNTRTLRKPLGKYLVAVAAWWGMDRQTSSVLWDVMEIEVHDLQSRDGDGVYMVHEGEDGPHDLVGYDSEQNVYLIYGNLEHTEIRASLQPI